MKEKLAEMMDMIIAEDEQGASDVFHSYVTNKLSQLIESDSDKHHSCARLECADRQLRSDFSMPFLIHGDWCLHLHAVE